jgi:STE24 endopeptidase
MSQRLLRAFLLLMVAAITGALVQAAEPPAAAQIQPAGDAWRAALPADPEAATSAYLARIPPEMRARSDAYFEGGYVLKGVDLLFTISIAALLLFTPLSRRLFGMARRASRRPALQATAYAAMYLLVVWLLTLPLAIYSGFVREHAYGMATNTFAAWFADQASGLGLTLVVGAPFIALLLWIVRRFERTWWLWGTVAVSVLMAITVAVAPVYVDPLFNDYKPLESSPLQQRILAIARANGVPVDNVMWFDASKRTTRVSANVSGLFGTAAVRLNDNLLERSSPAEILAVVGHETGHYAMNHIPKSMLQFGLLIAAVFAATAWLARRLLGRFGPRWGLRALGEPMALPLLAAVVSVVMLAATPLLNTIIRTMEAEADLFGLNASREPDGMAEVLLKLVEYRKAEPGALEEFVFFDHPSAHNRILAAMRWKAEMLKAPAPKP